MILFEPASVNSNFRIFFGTRQDFYTAKRNFIATYLHEITRRTGIKNFVLMKQSHSTNIAIIKKSPFKDSEKCNFTFIENTDGIYTSVPNISLCIKTADCVPIFITTNKIVAALHMGWRGAYKRIISRFIEILKRDYNTMPEEIHIFSGPHIRKCCYSVGSELVSLFQDAGYNVKNIFTTSKRKTYLSLEDTIYEQIDNYGIPHKNVHRILLCTSCLSSIFYSYRKGISEYERNISLIIKDGGNQI